MHPHNRDPENQSKTVICILKNGVWSGKGSQKCLKNGSKNGSKMPRSLLATAHTWGSPPGSGEQEMLNENAFPILLYY